MPVYALNCDECGLRWEEFAPIAQREAIVCKCGRVNPPTDYQAQGAPGMTGFDWDETSGTSLAMRFDPNGRIREQVPSIELDKRGNVRFRNDQHQKQVYREMQEAADRECIDTGGDS